MNMFDKNDLSGFIGKQLVYTYHNDWKFELYVKNGQTIDYRMHVGQMGNHLVKNQYVVIVRVGESIYKMSWAEPNGINVSLSVNIVDKILHGTGFFPRWVIDHPEKTICIHDDHVCQLESYRDAGPIYPIEMVNEFSTITFMRDCGPNDESIIACAASELPADYHQNLI